MHQTMHSQVHEASDASHEIPTIDISGFRSSPETAQERIETQHVVDRVRSACLTTGFFCLTGHGIPRELQERVLDGAEKFFDMPLEEKLKLVHPTQKNRGYEVLGGQTLQRGAKPDLKEVSCMLWPVLFFFFTLAFFCENRTDVPNRVHEPEMANTLLNRDST